MKKTTELSQNCPKTVIRNFRSFEEELVQTK